MRRAVRFDSMCSDSGCFDLECFDSGCFGIIVARRRIAPNLKHIGQARACFPLSFTVRARLYHCTNTTIQSFGAFVKGFLKFFSGQ